MAEESPAKAKFIPYTLDLLALAFLFGFVDGLRTGQAWYAYLGCLLAAIVLLLIAFNWVTVEAWLGLSKNRQSLPVVAMMVLAFLTISAVGYDIYDRHANSNADIPEFDSPIKEWRENYGGSNHACTGAVNGDAFIKYRADYKIALACYYSDTSKDVKDIPLYIGAVHDIGPGIIDMSVTYNPLPMGLNGARNILALLVPRDILITQFQTARQARSLGVKIKSLGAQTNSVP